jgi:N-acetylglucosamine-6-phosphate deacetylase
LRYATKLKKRGTVSLITDAMSAAGLDITHGTLGSKDDALPVIIEDGVAKLTDRSAFAGSVATADRLLKNILAAGVLLPEAIKMLTVYPLKAMHLNVKKGQIITGYDADLCVFDNDIYLQHVFCRGEMVK